MEFEIEKILKNKELLQYWLDMFAKTPRKIQELLLLQCLKKQRIIYPQIWECEMIKSPIEQIFLTAFNIYCAENAMDNIHDYIYLCPQYEIICNNKRYFADFLYESDDFLNENFFDNNIKNKDLKLIIECDGYEFHQKTKEQVQKDNEREYNLKMAGYEILRFSGTQIYNNPFKCAEDTYNYIIKRIGE